MLPTVATALVGGAIAIFVMAVAARDPVRWAGIRGFQDLGEKTTAVPRRLRRRAIANMDGTDRYRLEFDRAFYTHPKVGDALWVVPGRRGACLVEAGGGSSCGPLVMFRREGLALELGDGRHGAPGSVVLAGVVPDTVRAVRVELVSGKVRQVPVRGDLFSLRSGPMIIRGLVR